MGEEGCHRLRCARRGARASFLPGSEGSNGIVWPPRLRKMHRLDHRMNEDGGGPFKLGFGSSGVKMLLGASSKLSMGHPPKAQVIRGRRAPGRQSVGHR